MANTYEVEMEFQCCGNVITTTGPDCSTGKHTESCLSCGADDPDVDVDCKQLV